MHANESTIPLLKFNQQDDIVVSRSNLKQSFGFRLNCRHTLHQVSLLLFIFVYLVFGGLCFAWIESKYSLTQDLERQMIIRETHTTLRKIVDELFNEELNENFEKAYAQWRWNRSAGSNFINLNTNRTLQFENRTDFELETLFARLTARRILSDRYTYKWTYSTAILYAATLVTTIGYGNISPKTQLGKIITVIYALIGILLVVSWLKSTGESLALSVIGFYCRCQRLFRPKQQQRQYQQEQRNVNQCRKIPIWVPLALLVIYLMAGSILFATWEGWSYTDSAYFAFITFTTIGFGDFVPGERTMNYQNGRSILCAFYLLFGVMWTAVSFELIQEDIDRLKSRLFHRLKIEQDHLLHLNSK